MFSINLWSIMKNCVGKDLSKIPIPVNFSEPISMLQRMTEELEYSSVLDMAAKTNDSWEQLAYVAAFTISSYSTTATRVNKPFNPLLGETYECDRTDDLGWKSIAGKDLSKRIFYSKKYIFRISFKNKLVIIHLPYQHMQRVKDGHYIKNLQ